MTTEWSEFIPPGKEPEVVELAGKWKHGWIPLDPTATSSKMKGRTGGKKWWSGKSSGGGARRVAGGGRGNGAPAEMQARMAKQKPESTKTIMGRGKKSGPFDVPGKPVEGGKKKVLPRSALRSNQYGHNAFSPGHDANKATGRGRDNIPSRLMADPDFNPDTYEAPAPKVDRVLFRKTPGQKKAGGKKYEVGFGRHNPTRAEADKALGYDKPTSSTKYPRTIHADKIRINPNGKEFESPDTAGFARAHGWNLPKDYQPSREQIEAARGALAKKLGVPKSQIKKSVGAMGFFHGKDVYVPNSSGGFTKRASSSGKA